jgi:hypothetical protein
MIRRAVLRHAVTAAILIAPAPAGAQTTYGRESTYEREYGDPIDISLSDLEHSPESYLNRAVRARGTLDLQGGDRDQFTLRDSGATVKVVPLDEVEEHFKFNQMEMVGRAIEIVGVVKPFSDPGSRPPGVAPVFISFWSYLGAPEESGDALKRALEVSLESLVTAPGRRDGQLVRVLGRFRGGNLYGDLPAKSRRGRGDWVIKDEAFAVWVTGKKPRGDGFDLETSLKRDSDKWLEIIGRPATYGGVTRIQAIRVALSGPPARVTQAPPAPPAPERPKVPPVIVFAMPVDGEDAVASDSRFTVQFSKDMEESSFQHRVVLRYAGPARPGDQPMNMTFTYDRGRRTLIVDPGIVLQGGRQVELLLLPGIVDSEGLVLGPRAALGVEGFADILRYSTGP